MIKTVTKTIIPQKNYLKNSLTLKKTTISLVLILYVQD